MNEKTQYNILILNNIKYGIPMSKTLEYSEYPKFISQIPRSKEWVVGMIKVKNQLVPMVNLAKRLNIENSTKNEDKVALTVQSSNGTKCCLIFDQNDNQIEINKDEIKAPTGSKLSLSDDFIEGYTYINEETSKDMLILLDIDKLIDQKHYVF